MANILQWNCQGIKKKVSELEYLSINYDIILLCETWLRPSDRFIIRNFDTIRSDRTIRNGGDMAILIRNGIKYRIVFLNNSCGGIFETCSIEIYINDKSMILASCYRPPHSNISYNDWVSFFDQFNDNHIVGGDNNDTISCGEARKTAKKETNSLTPFLTSIQRY